MYEFIDTTELQSSGSTLPSEALNFNGYWLEEEIPGYRTLNVSGREMISNEITDLQVGVSDGSRYQRQRYEPRIITVTYQLFADSNGAFREAYNKLNALLDAEECRLIFNDERDKFFVGTRSGFSDVPAGRNCVIGEIEFVCSDPFKYTLDEFEASPTLDDGLTFAVDYRGTYKAFPVLEAKTPGDNGYVGFIDQNNHILQFGNVEEMDGENYEKSETLIDDVFTTSPSGWTMNQATTVKVVSEHKQIGTAGYADGRLCALDYGDGTNWHGPSWTKQIPADSKGHTGAKNCTFSWHHYFSTGTINDLGVIQFLMTDANKRNVAAVTYWKNAAGQNFGNVHMYVNGNVLKEISLDCGYWNTITGLDYGRSSIAKFGGRFDFSLGGQVYSFNVPEMADIEVVEVSVFIGKWGSTYPPIGANFVYSLRFVSHSVPAWRNIPNKFGKDDVLKVDCSKGSVMVNGVETAGLGALGNDWENFYLAPGNNQIRCAYSGWAQKPEFKLKYREVYL